MDLNVQTAKKLLNNPPPQLNNLLSQSTDEAKSAIAQARNGIASDASAKGGNGEAAGRLQIVDEEKKFSKDLNPHIKKWGLLDAGFGYDVLAVFGSQSTGKSTLLNKLFGTTFDVMDETQRRQTTKGIWMHRAATCPILVLDVEGTDGRERGEDQDFERKSALFSLASSEVLLVNIWEHQVGLYQGANMALLKTVFEVNLHLFGKRNVDGTNQRTLLFFVIRDFVGSTPLSNLRATLVADLEKIWESISKPDELKSRKLTDYFDLAFEGLAHKILMPEKFEQGVADLRKRFVDRENPDYVFKPAYHKRIPADGVAIYMANIWEQVESNKDLDLPTQQELLAQFRCDEIAAVAMEKFNTQAKSLRRAVEGGKVVEGLGASMKGWRGEAVAEFDKAASRYNQQVYKRKRQDLISQIDTTLHPMFLGQLKSLHKLALSTFKKDVQSGLKGEGYDFGEVVRGAGSGAVGMFLRGAKEAFIEDADWSFQEELEQLKEEITHVADQLRADETKKMVNLIERTFKRQISEPVEVHLNKPLPDMWDKILIAFKESLDKAEAMYLTRARSFNTTPSEDKESIATLRTRAWLALRNKVNEQTADAVMLTKLRNNFEERFRYDENGVPRVWKAEDDIDGVFQKAREETLKLIPLYAKIAPSDTTLESVIPSSVDVETASSLSASRSFDPSSSSTELEPFDLGDTLIIFSETKQLDLSSRFRRDADAYYVEAKRSTVSSVAQIPFWIYIALVVLGWNEAMAVLFNPLYFTMLIAGLASAWIIVQLNLVGPLFSVTRTVMGEVQRQASTRLREHFSQPLPAPPVQHRNSTGDSEVDDRDRRDIELKQL